MKICVYGAGAIGGSIAVRLSRAGADVSVVARGEHGRAIRRSGLTLLSGADRHCVRLPCVEDAAQLPPQDIIVVTVKGPGLPAIADPLRRMLGPDTRLVFVMNGIPWWFGAGLEVALPDSLLNMLDPGALLRHAFPPDRIIWGVVYSSNEVIEPGVVCNSTPRNRLCLGKPDGTSDPRLDELVALLARAGYTAQASAAIRQEVWIKMLVVVGASPICALTGGSMEDLIRDAATRDLVATVMREAAAMGRRLGFTIPDDIDQRLAYYGDATIPVRPSMQQDFEAGREPEIESGILAFSAIAAALGQKVPAMDVVAALVRAKKKFRRLTTLAR